MTRREFIASTLVALAGNGEWAAAKIGPGGFPYAVRNATVDEVRNVP